jgi:hypothetical protein
VAPIAAAAAAVVVVVAASSLFPRTLVEVVEERQHHGEPQRIVKVDLVVGKAEAEADEGDSVGAVVARLKFKSSGGVFDLPLMPSQQADT